VREVKIDNGEVKRPAGAVGHNAAILTASVMDPPPVYLQSAANIGKEALTFKPRNNDNGQVDLPSVTRTSALHSFLFESSQQSSLGTATSRSFSWAEFIFSRTRENELDSAISR
jgi:hypothetical protein